MHLFFLCFYISVLVREIKKIIYMTASTRVSSEYLDFLICQITQVLYLSLFSNLLSLIDPSHSRSSPIISVVFLSPFYDIIYLSFSLTF